jgi:phospholipid/cholesterol/gamma-HCH transport system substrate-binding protein
LTSTAVSRVLALASLVLGVVVLTVLLVNGGGPYKITARFVDAGQLVKGDLVEVGGRKVGTVDDLVLSDDGLADVKLKITDDGITPLHEGTTATIRTVGLASVTNRVVALEPGPATTPKLPDGGLLPTSQTRGVVDLDMLLDAVDPTVRKRLKTIVHQAAKAFAKPAPEQVNQTLLYLNPALSQTAALGRELVADQAALERLITSGAAASGAVAQRDADLAGGLESGAAALRQIADRRDALTDILDRGPPVLRQTRATLDRLTKLLPIADPVIRDIRPSIAPLARLLRDVPPVVADSGPAIDAIRALLPKAVAVLKQVPAVDAAATPALKSTTIALKELLPIVAGLRVYAPDFIGGLFNGFGGSTAGYYDANGHFIRITLQGSRDSFAGTLIPSLPGSGFDGLRTGLMARCPGAAEEPAPDKSNPWIPDTSLCDPKQTPAP